MKKIIAIGVGVVLVLLAFIMWPNSEDENLANPYSSERVIIEVAPEFFFGFDKEEFSFVHDTISRGEVIGDILNQHLEFSTIEKLLSNCKEHFDPRRIKIGRPFHWVTSTESPDRPLALIYEKDAVNYTVLHLQDSLYASPGVKPIRFEEMRAEGIIESSLYLSLTSQGLSQNLAMEMAEIYAWTIDFYRLQKGDRFTVLYEGKFIDDQFIGIGEIKACQFDHKDRSFEAYAFTQPGEALNFYNEEGQGMRKAFLKSPLKFGRMSSGFSNRRFHPVQKRFKAHKGTDYAAPTGTPILSTGDGTVIESRYKRNNGNYVKIRHNNAYTTQYLHMSKRKVNVGEVVKQGDVIGLVGSTGLATGPHVCYRFWKNGAQVDHRQEEFPSTSPILEENKSSFDIQVSELKKRLALPDSSPELLGAR